MVVKSLPKTQKGFCTSTEIKPFVIFIYCPLGSQKGSASKRAVLFVKKWVCVFSYDEWCTRNEIEMCKSRIIARPIFGKKFSGNFRVKNGMDITNTIVDEKIVRNLEL